MVLLAASVVSKQNGKILVSRQFVEMSRSRIEGVLTAFSKLITKDKQHTFIETDTVRYVYQALMNKLYCVLITTKTSNILEDLETLRLFVRVINEYTTTNKNVSDEQAILDNAFTLLFAFDEIVALGYRENVNMTQVRTFIEMDSHEERVFEAVRQSQERDAKQKMREKAKELSKLQRTQQIDRLRGGSSSGGMGGGSSFGSNSYSSNSSQSSSQAFDNKTESKPFKSSPSVASKPKGPSRALKLGSKNQNIFSPVAEEQLATELKQEVKQETKASVNEAVHITIEEKLNLEMSRDGAVRTSELTGVVMINIEEEQFAKVKFLVECDDAEHVQIQSHPNVDKELFKQQGLIALRGKSFPVRSSVGVLKYRRISPSGNDWPPLMINCWPNGNNCNLELVLNKPLSEITISIPCPSQPTVNECTEGDYSYRRGELQWNISVLAADLKTATLDFDLPSSAAAEFFPISCAFSAAQNLAGLIIKDVVDDEVDDIKWSIDAKLNVERYEIN